MTFSSHFDPGHFYFVTATVCGWKHLFAEPALAKVVLDSLEWLRREQRLLLFAFVLMPSHIHFIAKPEGRSIGELTQEFGSYTAHALLKQLKSQQRIDLLQFFRSKRRDRRHQHSLWQDIQSKNVYSYEFLRQKLDYIHNNPLGKHWRLANERSDYKYSSACFYDRGERPIVEVDDVRPWLQ